MLEELRKLYLEGMDVSKGIAEFGEYCTRRLELESWEKAGDAVAVKGVSSCSIGSLI